MGDTDTPWIIDTRKPSLKDNYTKDLKLKKKLIINYLWDQVSFVINKTKQERKGSQ